jgi:hypothetical protein
MKRRLHIAWAGLLACGLLAVARADDDIEAQFLSPRIWYVNWDFGGEDLGGAPLLMLNWNVQFPNWHYQVLGGYGEGWESDFVSDDFIRAQGGDPSQRIRDTAKADRLDLQWQLGRKFALRPLYEAFNIPGQPGHFMVGAAYHYVDFRFDAPLGEAEYFYHGPELLVGFTQPMLADGLSLRAHATYLPYAWATTESPEINGTDHATTDGLLFDVGPVYQTDVGFPLHTSVGYRYLKVNSSGEFAADHFAGFYVEAGIQF